jgi:hypothetical protein
VPLQTAACSKCGASRRRGLVAFVGQFVLHTRTIAGVSSIRGGANPGEAWYSRRGSVVSRLTIPVYGGLSFSPSFLPLPAAMPSPKKILSARVVGLHQDACHPWFLAYNISAPDSCPLCVCADVYYSFLLLAAPPALCQLHLEPTPLTWPTSARFSLLPWTKRHLLSSLRPDQY